jgi:hypothetical protein
VSITVAQILRAEARRDLVQEAIANPPGMSILSALGPSGPVLSVTMTPHREFTIEVNRLRADEATAVISILRATLVCGEPIEP